jgi:hypothetical protein
VPKKGIPYLSKEGYPYRVFVKAHPELVKSSKKVDIVEAIRTLVHALGSASPKKAASMFKLCFSASEMERALG